MNANFSLSFRLGLATCLCISLAGCSTESAPAPADAQAAGTPESVPMEAAPEKPQAGPLSDIVGQRVPAAVGVGKQGRSLDNETGIGGAIAQPAKTLFAVKEKAVFEIQIPHAMNLFKATNGNAPKSHEEFMSQIIKANRINLPELPAGKKYVYDPEQAQLMVE